MDGRPFRAELEVPAEGYAVVAVAGELDLETAPQFKAALLRGIDDGGRRVVVDLSEVSFIDSTAIGVLMGGVRRLHSAEGSLDVVYGSDHLGRIFELVGLDRALGVYACRAEDERREAAVGGGAL